MDDKELDDLLERTNKACLEKYGKTLDELCEEEYVDIERKTDS
jgi:hypothetical protein